MAKKILIITPKFPYPPTGACQKDRFSGIKNFLRYGFEVRVITKIFNDEQSEESIKVGNELGIKVFPVRYKFNKNYLARFLNPFYLDGSAFEFTDIEIKKILESQLDNFRPDYVYFDYTFMWPLYGIVKKRGIPIITRSHNFEPTHFLDENGRNIINYFRFLPKLMSEFMSAKKSDLLFSISPKEEKIYTKMGAKKAVNLPLRWLPFVLKEKKEIKKKEKLEVFFMGSTYNVSHNKKALEFIVKDVVPVVRKSTPDRFIFHILGAKIPEDMKRYFCQDVIYESYVPDEDLDGFLGNMDIAIVPSLFGAGMQQKIFEPLARGFPVITQKRGLGGYDFKNGKELLLAESAQDFASKLIKLEDIELRKKMSEEAIKKSFQLFNQDKIDNIILSNLP